MDLSKIEDIKELKALAFDQLQQLETTQNNIRLIQQRIAELENAPKKDGKKLTAQ